MPRSRSSSSQHKLTHSTRQAYNEPFKQEDTTSFTHTLTSLSEQSEQLYERLSKSQHVLAQLDHDMTRQMSALRQLTGDHLSKILQGESKQFLQRLHSMVHQAHQQIQNNLLKQALVGNFFQPGRQGGSLGGVVGDMLQGSTFKRVLEQGIGQGNMRGMLGSVLGRLSARGTGGNVGGGAPYLVGEHGPELFMPHHGGKIIPHHTVRGASAAPINLTFNVHTPDVGGFKRSQQQVMSDALHALRRAQRYS